jgi:phospho-N-acetylmuramoyl-pentapeptide-transferase
MLYYLLYPLAKYWSAFYVFKYSTFRAIYAALTAVLVTFLIGKFVINKLNKMKASQPIREDGPKTHQLKTGTPTMGGIIIIIAVLFSVLMWAKLDNGFILLSLFTFVFFAVLGGLDDYIKLVKKNSKGLSIKVKLIGQILGAGAIVAFLFFNPVHAGLATHIKIPLVKFPVNLGVLYFVFVAVVIIGWSNAVNFTDGLDGLATGSLLFTTLALAVVIYVVGHIKFSEYLKIVYVPEASELVIFCAAIVGACLGFLWYNSHPAQVFMGDVGSLPLGAVLGLFSVLVKLELLIVLIGGIFVMEAFSVLIQITSFRLFKKRVFKMAPLHHHFELKGMPESKIVIRFWIVAILIALASLSLLKLR